MSALTMDRVTIVVARETTAVGQRIVEAMKRKGVNQAWLAVQLEVSDGLVSRWINGKAEPLFSNGCAICKALDISPSWLLTGTENWGQS